MNAKKVMANYSENFSFFGSLMPSADKILSRDIILLFPRTNKKQKLLPFIITYLHQTTQTASIFPYKFE
jgi:hypothetical protein